MVLGTVVVLACSSVSERLLRGEQQLDAALRARGLELERVSVPFRIDDAMRTWVHDNIPAHFDAERKLLLLRDLLIDPQGLAIQYRWGHTGTAAEVFSSRTANCLAFTSLFVGMAREAGLAVYFLAVEEEESYQRRGDLVVVSDHIAVGHGEGPKRLILDFAYDLDGQRSYRFVKALSDLTATAMYHSNRGAEALQAEQVPEAVRWLRTAVEIDPELASAWINLGVALRRSNEVAAAEEAYRHAIELEPQLYSGYQNLASLLRFNGRVEEAEALEAALERAPSRNPYTYLSLGDISLYHGRIEEARRLYRRAIHLGRGEAEVYAALGQLAATTGDLRTARRMLKKARNLDDDNPRTLKLGALLEDLSPQR